VLAAFRIIRRVRYQRPRPLTRQSAKRTDGKVAQVANRHLHAPVANGGAGGEDEWVAAGLERAFPHGEPSKLARDEAEARMTLRLHHQRMGNRLVPRAPLRRGTGGRQCPLFQADPESAPRPASQDFNLSTSVA
jgi:hypothetical protein